MMRINERGEWTELGEISIGTQPAKKFWELTVQPKSGAFAALNMQ
jgi:hypothetical protein